MNKNKGMIILAVILAVQFIIPLGIWGYETYKNKELEEKGCEVKLLVDRIYYDETGVTFRIDALEELFLKKSMNYIVFDNNENGFSGFKEISGFPESDLYVSSNRLYDWYSDYWGFYYESEAIGDDYYGFAELYSREMEQANINHGFIEGPETEAYAVFKVYKNRIEVVNVYLDGVSVDIAIEKNKNSEWDTSRYDIYRKNSDGYEIFYDYETEDYVTVPVEA